MSRFYIIFVVCIAFLLIVEEANGFKSKKDVKKSKDVKIKGKAEEILPDGEKSRYLKHVGNQRPRPTRSAKEVKVKSVTEESEGEEFEHVIIKRRKPMKPQTKKVEETEEESVFQQNENSCEKKIQSGITQRRKMNSCCFACGEPNGNLHEKSKIQILRKGKDQKLKNFYSNSPTSEEEANLEEEEMGIRPTKRNMKEKKVQNYLSDDLEGHGMSGKSEDQLVVKTTKHIRPRSIVEDVEEAESENVTGGRYVVGKSSEVSIFDFEENGEEYDEEFF